MERSEREHILEVKMESNGMCQGAFVQRSWISRFEDAATLLASSATTTASTYIVLLLVLLLVASKDYTAG